MGQFDSLRYRDYRLVWTGAFLSNVGTWMQSIALNWYVLLLTHSTFWVSFVTFINFMPTVISPIGGAYSDRVDRRRILVVTQTFMMVDAAVLALWVWLGHAGLAPVLILTFGLGLAVGFNNPTWMAFVPSLVPSESLVNAIALNSGQFSLARVIGPAIAGPLIGAIGAAWVFGINALSFVAVLIPLVLVSSRPVAPAPGRDMRDLLRDGFRYTMANRRIRSGIGAIAVASFFAAPVSALMPIFTTDVYHRGAAGYGGLAASMGIGSVIGALGIARLGNRVSPALIGASLALLGASLFGFAVVSNYLAGLVLLAAFGFMLLVAIAATNGDIQLHVDEAMRGRVLSLYFLSFGGLFPLGALAAGGIASVVGVQATTAGGAAFCIAWGVWLYLRFRGAAAPGAAPAFEPGA